VTSFAKNTAGEADDQPIQLVTAQVKPDVKASSDLLVSSQQLEQSGGSGGGDNQDKDTSNTNVNSTLINTKNRLNPRNPTQRSNTMSHLTMSSPGFDAKSVQSEQIGDANTNFKRNHPLTRSVHSYDYNNLRNSKQRSAGNFRSNRSMPTYSTKQLHLIYSQYKQERQEKMGVPMLTTLLMIPLYLAFGMMIFSSFEKWTKLDAFYFCFITLFTIGFGDIMPGSTFNINNNNKNNLYISALYIFIGLIMLAMCIDLVKNQLKYKLNKIARKFGLSSTSDH
jgi:hypothetical protein